MADRLAGNTSSPWSATNNESGHVQELPNDLVWNSGGTANHCARRIHTRHGDGLECAVHPHLDDYRRRWFGWPGHRLESFQCPLDGRASRRSFAGGGSTGSDNRSAKVTNKFIGFLETAGRDIKKELPWVAKVAEVG